jgi:hypothetical protein
MLFFEASGDHIFPWKAFHRRIRASFFLTRSRSAASLTAKLRGIVASPLMDILVPFFHTPGGRGVPDLDD